jgi:hypothetical protein
VSNPGRDALVAMLSRLKSDLHGLNLSKPEIARAALQAKYPLTGDYLVEVRRLWQRGVEEGWLREGQFGAAVGFRLAPPNKYFPFSIDAMVLGGHVKGHGHPKGEVSLTWAMDGSPRYCGSDAGWMVCSPGSKHVPEVKGGTMFVLTFVPEGKLDLDVKLKLPVTVKAEPKAGARRTTSLAQASRAAAAANRASTTTSPTAATRRASAR